MTIRLTMALVLAGAFTVEAETSVTSDASSVPANAGTNQASVMAPAPVVESGVVETSKPIPGVDEAGFALEQFSLGTRITHYELETTHKNYFLGHLNKLEAIQDNAPTKLYADWWFHRYLGVELTWDRVEARVHNDDPEGISDGNLVAEGPIATMMARYPNKTRVTPHAGIGMAFMSVAFDEAPWWALGYDGPDSYEMLGSPTVPRNGKTREMLPDDSAQGVVATAGVDARISRHWSADVYWRYMDLDVKMGFRTGGDVKDARDIPLSNMAFGAGVKYVF